MKEDYFIIDFVQPLRGYEAKFTGNGLTLNSESTHWC